MTTDNPHFRLDDQVALVTGGGTGLGLSISRALAEAGARVVIVGRRVEVLREAAKHIGEGTVTLSADVTDLPRVPDLVARIEKEVGSLSILVNNAGIHLKKSALQTTDAEFDQVLRTHLAASFALSREAAKVMLPRRRGSIIFITSMAALFGIPNVSAYSAAKAAAGGLARALAVEWSGQGVRVNAIAPGWIDAGMARIALEKDPPRREKILSRTPMGHLGTGQDVGAAAVYLCSDAGRFVTGVTLPVDGGVSIGF